MSAYEDAARRFVLGQITFTQLVRESKGEIRGWATFQGRGDVPPHWDEDDIEQVLLMELWRALTRFDPERAGHCEPGPFARRAAKEAAKKATQRARGVVDRKNLKGPANYDRAFAGFATEDDREMPFDLPVEAEQEELRLRSEALAKRFGGEDYLIACAVAARGGSVVEASRALYSDATTRHVLRLSNEAKAERLTREWARSIQEGV